MLTILGSRQRVCSGLTRRDLLQAAGPGLLGVGLPQLLAARRPAGRARSVLFLLLFGGPSQLETFDVKPDAPSGIRGPFRPIAARTPGLRICEHLPRLAAASDRYCVVRTLTHRHNDHNAVHYILTGRMIPPADNNRIDFADHDWPAIGSVVDYLAKQGRGGKAGGFPSYLFVPNRIGFLQGFNRPGPYAGWARRSTR